MDETDVFISSTLQKPWNVKFNLHLCELLESKQIQCFLPQRDVRPENNTAIFEQNIKGIKNSKVVLSITPHSSVSLGLEAGYAYGIGKPILVLKSSKHKVPSMLDGMDVNIFRVKSLNEVYAKTEELILVLKKLTKETMITQ